MHWNHIALKSTLVNVIFFLNPLDNLWIPPLPPASPPPPYISRFQYVCYSCEQGWEGDGGRGNKGLMSLAEGRWRLRQMAWSLRHSGVARLVLKSSSLTFQQILPGGWGVCHTTPRIHAAVHPLHPATTPTPKKMLLCRSGRPSPLTNPYHVSAHVCIRSHSSVDGGRWVGLSPAC